MYESLLNLPGGLLSDVERMRRDLDAVFSPGLPQSIRSVAAGAFPAINVGTTPHSVEIYAFAPGIDPAKVEVTLDRGVLTIAGERLSTLPSETEKVSVFGRQRFSGRFKRAISLPEGVDPEQIQATYRDGVLNISVAREAPATPKRVTVN